MISLIYRIICVICMTLCGGTVLGLCLEKLLPANPASGSALRRLSFWTGYLLIETGIKVLCTSHPVVLSFILNLFLFGIASVFLLRFYTGKIFYRFSAYIALSAMMLAGDFTFSLYYFTFSGYSLELIDYGSLPVTICCIGAAVIGSIYEFLLTLLLLRKQEEHLVITYIPLLIMTVAIFYCVCCGLSEALQTNIVTNTILFQYLCVFLITYCGICFVSAQIGNRDAQRQLTEFSQAMELERMHYAEIEADREEMAKLRHDYQNVLSTIRFLIENSRTNEAMEMLDDMMERVEAPEPDEL